MFKAKSKSNKRKILLVIKLLLVLVLGHVVIRTAVMPQDAWLKLTPKSAGGGESIINVKPSIDTESENFDYSAILKRDLFSSQTTTNGEVRQHQIPDQTFTLSQSEGDELGLILIGTTAGSPVLSRAVIKDTKTNVTNIYRTGDNIKTASIQSIEKDRIVLLHKGQQKVLGLDTKQLALSDKQISRPIESKRTNKIVKSGIQPAKRPLNTFTDKLRHTAVMLPKAKVEPHTVAGDVEGLRVSDLDTIEGAKDLGLKDGDVIRAINGQQLNSKQKAFQIAMKARSQDTLDIELLRDDQIKKFSLPLK